MSPHNSSNRRAFLLGAGTVLFAGCTNAQQSGATDTEIETETTATATATATRATTRTETSSETTTGATDSTTTDETQTQRQEPERDVIASARGVDLLETNWDNNDRQFEVTFEWTGEYGTPIYIRLDVVSPRGFTMLEDAWNVFEAEPYEAETRRIEFEATPPAAPKHRRMFVSVDDDDEYTHLFGPERGTDIPDPDRPATIAERAISGGGMSEFVSLDIETAVGMSDEEAFIRASTEGTITNTSDRWVAVGWQGDYISESGVPLNESIERWISPLAPDETFLSKDTISKLADRVEGIEGVEGQLTRVAPLTMPPQSELLAIEDTEAVDTVAGQDLRVEVRNTGPIGLEGLVGNRVFDGDENLLHTDEERIGNNTAPLAPGESTVVEFTFNGEQSKLYAYDEYITEKYGGYFTEDWGEYQR
jgi:hypothetical protein